MISGSFIHRSTASGILTIIYSSIESSIQYLLVPRSPNQHRVSTAFGGIANGTKRVSHFVMEDNGLPFQQTAARVKRVFVRDGINTTMSDGKQIISVQCNLTLFFNIDVAQEIIN